jgi:hypothetical protein
MRKIFIVLVLISVLISCKKEDKITTQIPDQLLLNSDLEYNPNNGSSWFNLGGGGNDFIASWTDEDSFSPTHSIKIAKTTVDTTNGWYWYQVYSGIMPIGQTLTLTAKIKGVNLTGAGVSMLIRCDGANQNTVQFAGTEGITSITGNFDWSTYSVSLSNLSTDVYQIVFFLIYLPKTTGTVYFDDVTLTHK